jgi:4-amino-4-deoxy-L-arabinose transferase-like glycosyltransferase
MLLCHNIDLYLKGRKFMKLQIIKNPIFTMGVILLAVVLWGSEYFSRTLWEPDEARYVYVAKEMRADNHWLIPHRSGEYYAHKPPLMFWLQNAASVTTGGVINQVSGRLPSLLGAILSLLAVSGLASLWKERDAYWRVVLILPTTYLFWKVNGMGQIDALLCGLEMSALYLMFKADDETGGRIHRAFAYLFMGLAVIAKGPVGYIVPLGAYVTAQLVSGNRRQLKNWHFIWGFLIAMLPLSLWLFAAWRHGAPDGYFNELLFDQNTGRFSGAKIKSHHRPFWYFISHFLTEFMPWTLFLMAAVRSAIGKAEKRMLYKRLLGWFLFVVVFFSMSTTKRNLYILLAYPAAALFIATAWDDIAKLSSRWRGAVSYGTVSLLLLIGISSIGIIFHPKLQIVGWRILPVSVILIIGSICLLGLYRKYGLSNRWLIAFCSVLLMNQLAVVTVVYPGINPLKSPMELPAASAKYLPAGQELLLYKMRGEIYALYCNAKGLEVRDTLELRHAMNKQGKGMVIVPAKRWDEVKKDFAVDGNEHFFGMGHKQNYWVEYDLSR